MKAIITHYHGPTNTRGSRISARAEGVPKLYMPCPHELSSEAAHRKAAEALADRQAWRVQRVHPGLPGLGKYAGDDLADGVAHWRLEGGGLPDGTGYAFVFVKVEG